MKSISNDNILTISQLFNCHDDDDIFCRKFSITKSNIQNSTLIHVFDETKARRMNKLCKNSMSTQFSRIVCNESFDLISFHVKRRHTFIMPYFRQKFFEFDSKKQHHHRFKQTINKKTLISNVFSSLFAWLNSSILMLPIYGNRIFFSESELFQSMFSIFKTTNSSFCNFHNNWFQR